MQTLGFATPLKRTDPNSFSSLLLSASERDDYIALFVGFALLVGVAVGCAVL